MSRRIGAALLVGSAAAAPVGMAAALAGSSAWLLVGTIVIAAALEHGLAPVSDSTGSRLDGVLSAATALLLLAVWLVCATVANRAGMGSMAVGSILIAMGCGLRVAAMKALDDEFCSQVRAAASSAFQTRGVYALARHPSELGILLLGLGAAVLSASWAAAVLVLGGLLPLVLVRTAREDRALAALFGQRHQAYRARVSRFGLLGWAGSFARSARAR